MSALELSKYIFTDKYANHLAEAKRRESWLESGVRVFDMHRRKFAHVPEVMPYIDEAHEAFNEMIALGSQRVLQFGGAAVEKKNARAYNCVSTFADRPRVFQEAFWLLLCGCGTGFSVQWHHVEKLPPVSKPGRRTKAKTVVFQVPDTIEGWADALGVLMSSYFESDDTPFPEYRGKIVEFDFSLIRPEGSPLSSGSGKAPGPEPLRAALEEIRKLLDRVCKTHMDEQAYLWGNPKAERLWRARKMQPIDVYDIFMHASDAVLAGGVRRSASICIFSPDDKAMVMAKTGAWNAENPQRARSNNSALLVRGETSFEKFKELVQFAREWGEPGFYWSDSTEQMPNPCVEASFWPVDVETGLTGWQFCNLSLINMGLVRTVDQFRRATRAAAIVGTLQAAYTDFAYLGEVSERITRREALLGVSQTGMAEAPDLAFNPDVSSEMARLVLDVNEEVAKIIGINPCARATLLKPEGTSSCLLMTSSGIHDHHARRYFRRVQANHNEVTARWFQAHNPKAVEKSVWSKNQTDIVLTFCIEAPEGSKVSADTSAIDLLERVKLVKENWVDVGRRPERCTQPWLSHNVSNTVYVAPDEWDQVAEFIYNNRHVFAGISLLDRSGDLDFPQAPFCEVLDEVEIAKRYGPGASMASGLIVDGLRAFGDDLWKACDTALDCAFGIGVDLKRIDEIETSIRTASTRGLDIIEKAKGTLEPLESEEIDRIHREVENLEAERQVLFSQKDWVRRAKQFADRYFDGNVREMTYCLKHVHNLKLWHDLRRETVDVDYSLMHEEEDGTHFEAMAACAGGACTI